MEGEVKGKTFKMKGHTLPGINQRSDAKATNVAAEGLAGSSAFQQGLVDNTRSAFGGGGAGNVTQQPNPLPNVGVDGVPPPIMSKPSMAKDKAYKNMHLPENKNHNAKAATEQHFGDPHGPKPSIAKDRITNLTGLSKEQIKQANVHNNAHAAGKSPHKKRSMAKIYSKPKGKRTEY